MRESLRLVSGMLVQELEAATFLARDRKLNDTENKMGCQNLRGGIRADPPPAARTGADGNQRRNGCR